MITCWEKADILALLYVMFYCVFVSLPFFSGSGVVCHCISSWSLLLTYFTPFKFKVYKTKLWVVSFRYYSNLVAVAG